jgi:hypothetical protein
MNQRSMQRYRLIGGFIWLSVFFVIFSGVLILIISGPDDYKQCKAPLDIAPYRGIGIGANNTFSRLLTIGNDINPPVSFPDPIDISDLMNEHLAILHPSTTKFPHFSNLMWAWIQFISYDMILTHPSNTTDTMFSGIGQPPLTRSSYKLDVDGNRQQINYATPYLDASTIYGLDLETSISLRKLDGTGRMKTITILSQDVNDAELLPLTADIRVYQNPLLAALHVLFVREHNYWCERLKADKPYLSENELFNMARHFVISEIQSITYREVLPLLLGIDSLDPSTCFTHIDFNNAHAVDTGHGKKHSHKVSVLNEFAVGASRILHSMVTNTLILRNPQTGIVVNEVNLTEGGCTNQSLLWDYGIDDILLGASLQKAEKRDVSVVDMLRLFKPNCTNPLFTLNLGAIDIARGRDHMIPSYQDFYRYFKKIDPSVPVSCEEFAYSSALCHQIAMLYGSKTTPIDLFLGLLIETRHGRSTLGIVGTNLFKFQFSHIKHNDHYFYLWDRIIDGYVVEVHNVKLSTVILRNTNIDSGIMDPNVFIV